MAFSNSCPTALPLAASVGGPPASTGTGSYAPATPVAPGGDPPAAPTPASRRGRPGDPIVEPLPDPKRIIGPTVPQAASGGNPLEGDDPSPAVAPDNDPCAAPTVPPSGDGPYAPEVGQNNPKPQPGRSSSNVPLPDPRATPATSAPPYANCMRSPGDDPLADSVPVTAVPGSDPPDALAVPAPGAEVE